MDTHRKRLQTLTMLTIPLILVVTASGSASAQGALKKDGLGPGFFGTQGVFGMDTQGGSSWSNGKNQRLTQSRNIMISWSKNNDELRGFSNKLGLWAHLKIAKQSVLAPTVGDNVAALRVGDTMAAYSGVTGSWDVLKLSKGSKAFPTVSTDIVETRDNDRLYIFAASTGKWTSPDDPKFRRSNRFNDQPDKPFDQRAVKLARELRGKGLDDAQVRARITKAVAAAFDQRQSYQKAEAERMQQKLKKIQAAITNREALRERIIARRVDDLLDLNVDWDDTQPE